MQFFYLLATAALASAFSIKNPWSPIPGYPIGNPVCMSDAQASFVVKNFVAMLSNPDRQATNAAAQLAIADKFVESSDSINILEGLPLGSTTFNSKQAYIASLTAAPPVPSFTTIDIFHDCTKISWRWNIPSLGANIYPVKGINEFQIDPKTGQTKANHLEFNSIAWGTDIGWTCKAPGS